MVKLAFEKWEKDKGVGMGKDYNIKEKTFWEEKHLMKREKGRIKE